MRKRSIFRLTEIGRQKLFKKFNRESIVEGADCTSIVTYLTFF